MSITNKNLKMKDLYKKINYQLTGNFFSIDEFQSMSARQIKKVIKRIAKLENIKINRNELEDFVVFIKSGLKKIGKGVIKLWSFTKEVIVKVKESFSLFIKFLKNILSSYRTNKFELMLN